MSGAFDARLEAAAQPYRASGRYAWHFARGKLRHDPMFRYFMDAPPCPDGSTVLDLGCGQGVLLSWLAADERYRARELHGMELSPKRAGIARRALGARARIDCCDIRRVELPCAALIVIMDVLFYMSREEQLSVLENVAHALVPGGTLLLREADRGAGSRFHMTEWSERVVAAHRGRLWHALHYRSVEDWCGVLARLNLNVDVRPMYAGTPFSNMLYTAKKR